MVLLVLQLMGGMMLAPQRTFFPIYLAGRGDSATLISALAAARQMAGLIASLVGGSLSDRLGRKWTLLAGEMGFVLGSLVFLSTQRSWIAVLWTASGFGLGLHTLGGQSYLMDATPAGSLGVLSALYNWGYTLGGALSSPMIGFLLDHGGYRTFGSACTLFALITLGTNVFVLPQTRLNETASSPTRRRLFGYGEIATRQPIILLTLLRFLPTVYWGMSLVLLPLLLDAAGASKTEIALYATLSQVFAALSQVAVGWAADRLGLRGPTLAVLTSLLAGILGIGTFPGERIALFAFGTLSTAAAWSLSTLLPLWTARIAPPHERGRILGWVHLWWNGAMITGSMAGGVLIEQGASLPFLVAGALNLVTIPLALGFFNHLAWKTKERQG
jgi:MFS family permease